MASRLDAKKIERERFSSYKRPREPPDTPPDYILQQEKIPLQELKFGSKQRSKRELWL
jgi:hypothetical protein